MTLVTFSDLSLRKEVGDAVRELGFQKLTPVQAATIPQFLNHKDVIAEAVTGSGKTLAFLIPAVEILLRRSTTWRAQEIGAVILSPTRELALQTSVVLEKLLLFTSLKSCAWIGGRSPSKDVEAFNESGGNIIVATPGRCLDLIENHASKMRWDLRLALKSLEVLVLDEADRLLEMGFELSLTSIMSYLPKQRRTGMFSATQTTELKQLIRAGMRNPVVIKVQEKLNVRTPTGLTSFYTMQSAEGKLDHLVTFLRAHRQEKHLLFFATCDCVNYFTLYLQHIFRSKVNKQKSSFPVTCLHRKLKHKRQAVFEEFSKASCGVLVCTDVVARGIDWPDIDWVIQFDVPKAAVVYVHRIGRTARMGGRVGQSLLYLLPNEEPYVEFIRRNQQVPLLSLPEQSANQGDEPVMSSDKLKTMAKKDKDVYQKGIKAFVSYVRAYGQHECSVICRVKELDLGGLAKGFGLVKLPRMPELNECDVSDKFVESDVDVTKIPYRDKTREKQRAEKNARVADGEVQTKEGFRKRTEAFSIQKAKRLHTKERRLLKEIKKIKRKEEFKQEELDDLAADLRLIKKERLKKISRTKFNKRFAAADSEVDVSGSG